VFGKIETKIWDSLAILGLSDSCKLAFIYLLANKHQISNPLGYYILPMPYMANDLEWSVDKTKKIIKRLEQRGLVAYDSTTKIMWVINYLDYHTIKKNQTERSALASLKNMPLSKLARGLYARVKKEYPTMEFCSYLELLVSDPLLFGNETVTKQTRDGVTSISISKSNSQSNSNSYSEDFETFWSIWISLGRADNKIGAWDNWQTCLKGRNGKKAHDPVVATELLTAGRHYQEKCIAEGTQPRFVLLPATFLGPNQRWRDYLEKKKHINPDKAYAQKVIEEAKRGG